VLAHSQHVDARGWITNVTKELASDEFIRVAVRLWAIWHARQKAIHENIFQSPLSTHYFVERFISELEMTLPSPSNLQRGKPLGPGGSHLQQVMQKLMLARTSKNSNMVAVAAVARDAGGLFLGASAVVLKGITEAEIVESLAL
jgi:hypothetical protein